MFYQSKVSDRPGKQDRSDVVETMLLQSVAQASTPPEASRHAMPLSLCRQPLPT